MFATVNSICGMLSLVENMKPFVSSFHATNNSTKTKYHENTFVKVHKNCRFPRMQNIFIHIITQVNKLTLPVNCCVPLLTCCKNVLDLSSNASSISADRSFIFPWSMYRSLYLRTYLYIYDWLVWIFAIQQQLSIESLKTTEMIWDACLMFICFTYQRLHMRERHWPKKKRINLRMINRRSFDGL